MFKFDRLFLTMDKKGVSTYKLREECGIDSKTVRRLRANQNIEMKTLDRICSFLDCKIEEIICALEKNNIFCNRHDFG